MSMQFTWYGHSTWLIESQGHSVVIDPFIADPNSSLPTVDAVQKTDAILLTHDHADHINDCVPLAKRTGAKVVANFEIASWLEQKHGVQNTIGMNLGGNLNLDFLKLKMTIAHHSSQLPDGSYGGNPGGFVLYWNDRRIYIAGDTALFSDMQWIGKLGIDAAILPIGDLFTMGLDDSVQATQWIAPKVVLPCHYNTWPPIAQDANQWAEMIRKSTSTQPVVLKQGESFSL